MKKLASFFILALVVLSCGKEAKPAKFFSMNEDDFQPIISKESAKSAEPQNQKLLINSEFPLEVVLYQDGTFYYNMENFKNNQEGKGTWKFENGMLRLHAVRKLFDMNMRIHATDENKSKMAISFTDRHGPQTYQLSLKN